MADSNLDLGFNAPIQHEEKDTSLTQTAGERATAEVQAAYDVKTLTLPGWVKFDEV